MLSFRIGSRRQRQVAVLELKAVKFQGKPIQVEGQQCSKPLFCGRLN